ncbi:hypothetical protein GCM10010214_28990 [Streptomyces abikoensis]|nr:hypothetical protein GCM10010214_28990 [Streptomyces abikoensis]
MFEPQLIYAAGQARIGKAGLRDERGELTVGDALWGSFRHQPAGLPDLLFLERRELSGLPRPESRLRPAFIRSCEDRPNTREEAPEPPEAAPGKIVRTPADCGVRRARSYSGHGRARRDGTRRAALKTTRPGRNGFGTGSRRSCRE